MLIEMLKVILLGIVEGITEWLPISSTGHMILVDEFIKLNVPKDFMEMFCNCKSLINIEMGNWNVSNGKYFSNMICNCICLKIIQLPNTLKNLNYQIFKYCN